MSEDSHSSTPLRTESQESMVMCNTQSAGEGSSPANEPDMAVVKAAESVLEDHCWIPFGFQSQSIGPEGGKLCLSPSDGTMGGKEGQSILLEVPPSAVSSSESVEIRSAIIPDGLFTLPGGYQLGSMAVYIYYNGRCVTCPFRLHLPHWYCGEDHVRDGLSFAMAPHTLKEGEHTYQFKLLDGGMFTEQQQCGVLQLSGHCTVFSVVFNMEASSFYYASLWTHHTAGNVINDNKVCSKVVITYADPRWIEVLLEYWKEWRWSQADPIVQFEFSEETICGKLSIDHGEGWQASLAGKYVAGKEIKVVQVHKRDVKYDSVPNGCQGLESAVNLGIYPPYIHWVIQYDSPPDRSRGTKLVNLNIDGTKEGLSFPFTVYRVKDSTQNTAITANGGSDNIFSQTVHAEQVLTLYRERFIKVMDTNAVMYGLRHAKIISDGDQTEIKRTPDAKQQNEFLHDHLLRTCDEEALLEVCEMLINVQGNRKMNSLGRDMKCLLEKGKQTS